MHNSKSEIVIIELSLCIREDIPLKRIITFEHCPNQGGEAPAQKFWPSFYQALIPKISKFLFKSHTCMFSGNFLHHYHQNHHYHHHIYHLINDNYDRDIGDFEDNDDDD